MSWSSKTKNMQLMLQRGMNNSIPSAHIKASPHHGVADHPDCLITLRSTLYLRNLISLRNSPGLSAVLLSRGHRRTASTKGHCLLAQMWFSASVEGTAVDGSHAHFLIFNSHAISRGGKKSCGLVLPVYECYVSQ